MRTILAMLLILLIPVEWATAGAAPPDVRVVYVGDRLEVACDFFPRDAAAPSIVLGVAGEGYIRLPRRKRIEVGNQTLYRARGKGHVCRVSFSRVGGEDIFTSLYLRMKGDPFDLYGDGSNGTDVNVRTLTFRAPAVTRATVDGVDVAMFRH